MKYKNDSVSKRQETEFSVNRIPLRCQVSDLKQGMVYTAYNILFNLKIIYNFRYLLLKNQILYLLDNISCYQIKKLVYI